MVGKIGKIGIGVSFGLSLFLAAGIMGVDQICTINSQSNIPQVWHTISANLCQNFGSLNHILRQFIH